MKQLQNNFTTPEQSKRLLELGVPADSADCYIERYNSCYSNTKILFEGDSFSKMESFYAKCKREIIPCWSVGRLNEIFKICSDNHIEIYDLDLEGTQIERAMQAFENYAKYNWLDFSKLED